MKKYFGIGIRVKVDRPMITEKKSLYPKRKIKYYHTELSMKVMSATLRRTLQAYQSTYRNYKAKWVLITEKTYSFSWDIKISEEAYKELKPYLDEYNVGAVYE